MAILKFFRQWLKKDYLLLLFLMVFYSLYDVISISKQILLYEIDPGRAPVPTFMKFFYLFFIDWLVVVLFMSIIAFTTYLFIRNRISWFKIGLLHFGLSLLIGFAIRIITDIFNSFLGVMDLKEVKLMDMIYNTVAVMDYNFLVYFSMLFIIYSYYYFKEYQKNQFRKIATEKQAARDRIKMLTGQMQPHFLFNTLNCISSLISFDKKRAQSTLMDLSNFFREILKEQEQQLIPVKKEVETLNYYTNILRVRFAEQLVIEERIDPAALDVKMPALLLQPLVENAIKHGFSYDHNELKVQIRIELQKSRLIIEVENNGSQLNSGTVYGTGLGNIRERLEALYPEQFYFTIENKEETVVNVIDIPASVTPSMQAAS